MTKKLVRKINLNQGFDSADSKDWENLTKDKNIIAFIGFSSEEFDENIFNSNVLKNLRLVANPIKKQLSE